MAHARGLGRIVAAVALAASAPACATLLGVDDVSYTTDSGQADAVTDVTDDAPAADGAIVDAGAGRAERYRAEVLRDAPLAYWRLSDTSASACKNEIAGPYTGLYVGTPTFGEPGIFPGEPEHAVRFVQGTSLQGVPGDDAALLDFPHDPPFALEAWVKISAEAGVGQGYVLTDMKPNAGNGPSLGFYLEMNNPQNALRWERWANDALWAYADSVAVEAGRFHHVVVTTTADGVSPVLYLDAAKMSSGLAIADVDQPPNGTAFSWGPLVGTLDELAVYDHVLSAARVLAHFQAATP